ncbi:MAG TPA: FHA domain-containing protein [Chiayiivirga sp.]|nr:FHA domain-containing protein [Chiayiivirga sp.]
MRLVFRGRQRASVSLNAGELSFGASDQCDVQIKDSGWLPHHATLTADPQRGVWLRIASGVESAHVNARPIREQAMLRLGDVVSLGNVQFCVMLDNDDVSVRDTPSHASVPSDPATRAATARAVLRAVAGAYHGRTYSLGTGILLGTAADADIRIEDVNLAAHHARFSLRHEQVILRAEAEGNKLRVNGELVENAVLFPGDQVAIDPHRFVVEAPGLPPRGGDGGIGRQRPITQTMPAIRGDAPKNTDVEANVERVSSGRNIGYLLLAAFLIAGALGVLLLFGIR